MSTDQQRMTAGLRRTPLMALSVVLSCSGSPATELSPSGAECVSPPVQWIWCDDFDTDRMASYFEFVTDNGSLARVAGVGRDGSTGLRARFTSGQVSAGNIKLAFGRTPDSYMKPVDAGTQDYREIYWRFFVRNQQGWTGGGGDKLTRATIFAQSNWSQAMVAHVWSGSSPNENYLVLDPASGTSASGTLMTSGYNDASNFRWLGSTRGAAAIFGPSSVGAWHCVEVHVKLNTGGASNGVFEVRIDGSVDASQTSLNWIGNYTAYGLNSILIENYWNNGSPANQERYFDDFVVSTAPIGC